MAKMIYFEHGLGDYLDLDQKIASGDIFHCVFANELKHYYAQTGRKCNHIFPFLPETGFLHPDLDLQTLFPQLKEVELPKDNYLVLIAVQALEQFQVDPSYWDHFLELCLDRIEDQEDLTFLVKPHPRQDPQVVARINQFLTDKGLDVVLWDRPQLRSLSMEILFEVMADQVKYVFSPFSSTVFYLSKLYDKPNIKYYYSLQSLFLYTQNTPELYIQRWRALNPYLQEVFGQKAVEME